MTEKEIKLKLLTVKEARADWLLSKSKAQQLEFDLCSVGGISYESTGSINQKNGNATESAYIKLAQYQADEDRALIRSMELRVAAEKVISQLQKQRERDVLTRYYINGATWEQVAQQTNYSLRRVYQLHGEALHNIALYCTIDL